MDILEANNTPVGSYAPDFELLGTDLQVHHLSRYLEKFLAVCVISLCHNCPYVKLYLDRLKNIQAEFAPNSCTLIGINGSEADSTPGSTFDNMKIFSQQQGLNFPYLWDSTQDVTLRLGVKATPTAFLIDRAGILRYKGQIDDHLQNPALTNGNDYLRSAITCLLENRQILPAETAQIGTTVIWRR